MPNGMPRPRDAKATQRARSLARNAMKEASELTIRVLEGGKAPRPSTRRKKASPPKANASTPVHSLRREILAPKWPLLSYVSER